MVFCTKEWPSFALGVLLITVADNHLMISSLTDFPFNRVFIKFAREAEYFLYISYKFDAILSN